MPTARGKRSPPLRVIVEEDTDGNGGKLRTLSCGHVVKAYTPHVSKPFEARCRCQACANEGNFEPLELDAQVAGKDNKPRFCNRCGCRLRSGNKSKTCAPCSGH